MKIQNPILKGFNPDPSICRDGDDYYIATSTFEWFPGVQIHHSKDLKNWELICHPLTRTSQLNMLGNPDSGGIWAPCLTKSDDKFWLIYTDVKEVGLAHKDSHNYLVTADKITGEWSDPIYLNSSGFDPSLFHDDDGKKYLVNMIWDHRADNHSFGGIQIQEYSHEQRKLIGPKKIIFNGTEIALVEGPHLYKKDGYYYLMTAEGGTMYEHAVTMARSKKLFGDYEVHPQNPILWAQHNPENALQKTGHASMVPVTDDLWALVHLCGRPLETKGNCPLGRETAIARVVWKDNWPYVETGSLAKEEIDGFGLQETPVAKTYEDKDDFNDNTLNINFNSIRIPSDDFISLSENKGHLRIYGRESLCSKFTQAHIARRWQSFYFDAQTKVKFNPENFQQLAGLTIYYNTSNWLFLHITFDEEKGRILNLSHFDAGLRHKDYLLDDKICVPSDCEYVYLAVNVAFDKIKFSYSFDGINYIEIDKTFYSGQFSDDYIQKNSNGDGFFTGAFVGMATVDVSGERLPADFDYFEYIEK